MPRTPLPRPPAVPSVLVCVCVVCVCVLPGGVHGCPLYRRERCPSKVDSVWKSRKGPPSPSRCTLRSHPVCRWQHLHLHHHLAVLRVPAGQEGTGVRTTGACELTGSRQSLLVLQMLLEGSENQTPRICLPAAFPRVTGLGLWTEWSGQGVQQPPMRGWSCETGGQRKWRLLCWNKRQHHTEWSGPRKRVEEIPLGSRNQPPQPCRGSPLGQVPPDQATSGVRSSTRGGAVETLDAERNAPA